MDSTFKLLAIALLMCFSLPNFSRARVPDSRWKSKTTLVARLKLDDAQGSSNCWESLFQLQSCTSEVVLFFLNAEVYLGRGCCEAIRTIQTDCWPNLLGSLGYTAEEDDILEGYCDASEGGSTMPKPPPSPHVAP
ncbi:hypothetical protein OROMI_019268 [Orobanche minor]